MKLLEVFNIINEAQFLVERDVLNAREMKAFAQKEAEAVHSPPARTWYASQLYKYIINRSEAVRPVTPDNLDANAPEWLVAKMQAGEPVYQAFVSDQLSDQMQMVADWLNAISAENTNVNLRMSWEEAVRAQHEWHEDIARQARVTELTPEQAEGLVTLLEYPDGFKWVDVQTEVCLKHEGTMMGHCVGQGGYTQGVKEGTTKIISLRDPKGLAHATIEGDSEHPIQIPKGFDINDPQPDMFADALDRSFVDMEVRQIKGKENKPVVQKYRDYVIDFLTKFGITKFSDWGGRSDLSGAGIYELREGGYVAAEDAGSKVMDSGDYSWVYIDNRIVKFGGYDDNLSGKYVLADSNGHTVGEMHEKGPGHIDSIQNSIVNKEFQQQIIDIFENTGIKLDRGLWEKLKDAELGVNNLEVGHPQDVGTRVKKTSKGVIYATQGAQRMLYWLIKDGQISTIYQLNEAYDEDTKAVSIIFDKNYGWPAGNITEFLHEINPHIIAMNIPGSGTQLLSDLKHDVPGSHEIMEEDGIKFFDNGQGWYSIVDKYGHIIVNTNPESRNIKIKLAPTREIAGFYLVYLVDYLMDVDDFDPGEMTSYSSFAREMLDETGWFDSRYEDAWMYENEDYPIHMWEEKTFSDEQTEENDWDTTMKVWFQKTQLRDHGLENDTYAKMYDDIYHNHRITWEERFEPDIYDEVTIIAEDWWADNQGDRSTVTHPVSGGSMRVKQ